MHGFSKSIPDRKHLKRIPVWLPDNVPVIFHVTLNCAARRQIFISNSSVRLAVECLQRCETQHAWKTWNICFMPDHVHLLLSPLQTREQSLSKIIQAWKSCVTVRLRREGSVGDIRQSEFFDHLLRTNEKLGETWDYICLNPVRAGICALSEEYPYSGSPDEILNRLPKP